MAADAVSGDGSGGGPDAVWQADSARQKVDANGAMSGLDMVSYTFAIFASGKTGSLKIACLVRPSGAIANAA
ncbi:hypothetical protein [Burkholderia sp. BCC0405]|uniref:hypothetical protein n=1 Tax=Burkholderia sp. BCC0405 TaxID=2676298 RepID=UPI00158E63DF|nr:hypothetical protein [Burkholderia sp. BCC0405]